MKPKIKCDNQPVKHQRAHESSQQTSMAVRPPLPRDGTKDGRPHWTPGELPKGGFQSVWNFGERNNTKDSPVTVKEKKVY